MSAFDIEKLRKIYQQLAPLERLKISKITKFLKGICWKLTQSRVLK